MIEELRDEQFCYVTTTGRRTGHPHEIEIWFVVLDGDLFLMSGGGTRSDWVRNMRANPRVDVRIGVVTFEAIASVEPDDVDQDTIRRTMAAKYQGWEEGGALSDWARTAVIVRLTPAS